MPSKRLYLTLAALAVLWAIAAGSGKPDTAGESATSCNGNGDGCSRELNSTQSRAPPRGDDDRPRSWGKDNGHGETSFDDRKSPRTVAFLGRSANVRIYPNYSDTSVYLQLRFGKVQELDAAGRPIPNHAIPSLADPDAVIFSSGNLTLNGVNMSYVNVTVNPLTRQSFSTSCRPPEDSTSTSGGRRLLHARSLMAAAPQLNISLLFGLDGELTLPYGDANVTVPRNGLKWTVSYSDWPFCNDSNTLAVSVSLLLANNASAQVVSSSGSLQQQLRIVLGSSYNATLSFVDYALTAAERAQQRRMPVNISLLTQNASEGAGAATVRVLLPNPKPYNATGAVYDPTQTTTSAYLAADDPGNANSGTITAVTTSGGGTNAVGAVRVTARTVVAAVLLGIYLSEDIRRRVML